MAMDLTTIEHWGLFAKAPHLKRFIARAWKFWPSRTWWRWLIWPIEHRLRWALVQKHVDKPGTCWTSAAMWAMTQDDPWSDYFDGFPSGQCANETPCWCGKYPRKERRVSCNCAI